MTDETQLNSQRLLFIRFGWHFGERSHISSRNGWATEKPNEYWERTDTQHTRCRIVSERVRYTQHGMSKHHANQYEPMWTACTTIMTGARRTDQQQQQQQRVYTMLWFSPERTALTMSTVFDVVRFESGEGRTVKEIAMWWNARTACTVSSCVVAE